MKQLILPIILILSLHSSGQKLVDNDSVKNLIANIRKSPLDTAQVQKLSNLGIELTEKDSALSKQLLNEALAKSLQLKDADAITNSYRMLGIWYSYFDRQDESMEQYRLSLRSAESNQNKYLIAGTQLDMGNIKYWKGEYDSCIYFYLKAENIFEDPSILKDKNITERQLDKRKSDLYGNLSAVFNTLKNLPKADEYIDKAIAIAKKYSSPAAADALAFYMQAKADNYYENGYIEKALRTRLQFLPQMEQGKIAKSSVQAFYQNISRDYFYLKKMDSSMLFANKSLQVASTLKTPSAIANAQLRLAENYVYLKDYKTAEKYLYADATKKYFETTEDPDDQRDYFDAMRKLNFGLGNYKEAYTFFEKFNADNDSILKSEKAKEFSEREIRYQTEKKETQIKLQEAQLKQKTILNYFLIGGAIALLIILLLIYRNYTHRQKLQQVRINELETEKQLTATEAVLKGEEKERTRLAKDLHDGLGGMLSGIKYSFQNMKGNLIMTPDNAQAFERGMDMLDSSIQEMRRVAHNMMPEALVKFGLDTALKDFCNDVNQSGALHVNYLSMGLDNAEIEQTTAITIYRIVQELLNNTIKHASAKNAIVQITKTGTDISITIEDDGKGFDTAVLKSTKGIGWSNIQSRIDYLKGKLDVQSGKGKGTSVLIELHTA